MTSKRRDDVHAGRLVDANGVGDVLDVDHEAGHPLPAIA